MIKRMDNVGIVVGDLAAATEFFVELGLEPEQHEDSYRWCYVRGPEGITAGLR